MQNPIITDENGYLIENAELVNDNDLLFIMCESDYLSNFFP